jgi:OOP family OmpA-OmpF porin
MRKLTLLSYLLYTSLLLTGQNIQWAASVVDFSNQRSEQAFSANQILGAPNAMTEGNALNNSWSPKNENAYLGESIHVEFVKPMAIQQVVIGESQNPGSIETITLYDVQNRRHLVYENVLPQPVYKKNRLFQYFFKMTDYEVKGVEIQMQTSAVAGSNLIDAIGISAGTEMPKIDEKPTEELVSRGVQNIVSVPNAENLGPQINSQYAERLPIISPDGQTLYFARKYYPQNFGEENNDDIWYATRQPDGSWSKALNIGAPLNNKEHNFVVACSPSGNTLYLANDYRASKKDGVSMTVRKGRTWSQPKSLDIEDHYNNNEFVGYHVGVDGRTLLMSVERKDGLGKRDLYVSFKQTSGKWSKPQSLGSGINTSDEETSVFLAADGKTIYFASNGRPNNLGGLDIYMSKRLDDTWRRWTTPKNLGKEFNTPNHDFNFTIPASGDYAYFSSGPIKSSNLYRIKLPEELRPEPVTLVTGRIIDKESNRPINGQLKYQNLSDNPNSMSMDANAAGEFKVVVPYGENVGIYAEQSGYFAVSENLRLSEERLKELDYMPDSNEGGNDEELEQLQAQFNRLHAEVQGLENARQMPKKAENQPVIKGGVTAFRDPELEALRAKYYSAVLKNEPTDIAAKRVNETPTSNTQPATDDIEELDELARMKAKFNRANNLNEADNLDIEKIDSRTILKKKQSDDELTAMKAKYMKANNLEVPVVEKKVETIQMVEDGRFNELEEEVREELEQALLEDVKLDLQKELLEDAKQEVAMELDAAERDKLDDPTLDKEVKNQYIESVKAELRKEYEEPIKVELRAEWEEKIKEELRKTLRSEIRAELRRELRDEVKAELREELSTKLKKNEK